MDFLKQKQLNGIIGDGKMQEMTTINNVQN